MYTVDCVRFPVDIGGENEAIVFLNRNILPIGYGIGDVYLVVPWPALRYAFNFHGRRSMRHSGKNSSGNEQKPKRIFFLSDFHDSKPFFENKTQL